MRYTAIILLTILILAPVVSADDNDTREGAQKITEEEITGSVSPGSDPHDWYIIEIPPHTSVEVTVVLETFVDEHFIKVSSEDEDGISISEIDMDLTTYSVSDEDTYMNDQGNTKEIYVNISGWGSYRLSIFYQREFGGGCFSYTAVLGSVFTLTLLASIVLIRKKN